MIQQTTLTKGRRCRNFVAALLIVSLLFQPGYARAQTCENPFAALVMWGVSMGMASVGLIVVQRGGLVAGYTLLMRTLIQTPVMNRMDDLEDSMYSYMDEFWNNWKKGLQGMTKQVSASYITQSKMLGHSIDHSNVQVVKSAIENEELQTQKAYETNEDGCVFDSVSRYKTRADQLTKHMTNAYTNDVTRLGANRIGGPTSTASVQASRWDNYVRYFCNPANNNGNAGCTNPGENPDAHVMPSKLHDRATIDDITEPKERLAVQELTMNITGYQVPDATIKETFHGSAGIEARMTQREYLAQMDVANSMVALIAAERTPSETAPEVRAIRMKMGITDASEKPSAYEIRKSTVEQLWDPTYYVRLGGGQATISQKEAYLQAYSVQLLYRIIERMEKISTSYAIQGAAMVEKFNNRGESGIKGANTR